MVKKDLVIRKLKMRQSVKKLKSHGIWGKLLPIYQNELSFQASSHVNVYLDRLKLRHTYPHMCTKIDFSPLI